MVRAVFFDVDFTLIRPGPAFQGSGYRDFCAPHGIFVDPVLFDAAVSGAAALLGRGTGIYDPSIFLEYTRRIIEGMGGSGPGVDAAANEIYQEWAACRHFQLYDDVPDVLRTLRASGRKIGLISNTQRCLAAFQTHFDLQGLIDVAISSHDHGYMKPHPSIFEAALQRAGADAREAVMVGDSLEHDIEGARGLGMRGILVSRSDRPVACPAGVTVIHSLHELPALL